MQQPGSDSRTRTASQIARAIASQARGRQCSGKGRACVVSGNSADSLLLLIASRITSAFIIAVSKSSVVAPARVQSFRSLCAAGIFARFIVAVVFTQISFCHFSPAESFCVQGYAVDPLGI